MRPTKTHVSGFNFGNMPGAASGADTLGSQVESDGLRIHRTITGMDWSGKFRDSATSRANREKVQFTRAGDAFEKLGAAITDGHASMSHISEILKNGGKNWEDADYDVTEDWTVSDGYNYALAEAVYQGDDDALARIAELKEIRANNAKTATTQLQRLASEFDEADTKCSSAIRSALSSIAALTPLESALGSGIADRIGDKLKDGKELTPFERRLLELATELDPDERAALENGKRATMTQGEFDFLKEVVGDLDGLSMGDILALGQGKHHGEIQNNLANAVQMLGIPHLGTTSGDRGGMAAIPPNIRTLLTTNLTEQDRPGVLDRITAAVSPQGQQLDGPRIKHLKEFFQAADFFNKSDEDIRLGSDINRGVLKQAAEIAGATASSGNASDANGSEYLSSTQLDKALSSALAGAGVDRVASHDFITGQNMDVTCDNGGRYDAFTHLNDLASQRWNGETDGLRSLFDSVGGDVTSSNRYFADLAHESADSLGKYLGSDSNFGTNQLIGTQNPEFARILADSIHPYLGSYSGADGYGGMPAYGVGGLSPDEFEKMIASLSSDPETAAKLHTEAARWENAMAKAFGQDPSKVGLAYAAGMLEQSMGDGSQRAIDNYTDEQQKIYSEKILAFSTAKDLASLIPGGDKASWLMQQPLSSALFGPEPTEQSATEEWLKDISLPNGGSPEESSTPLALRFSALSGYLMENPEEATHYQDFMNEDGKIDWAKVKEDTAKFVEATEFLSSQWSNSYEDGLLTANSPRIPGTR